MFGQYWTLYNGGRIRDVRKARELGTVGIGLGLRFESDVEALPGTETPTDGKSRDTSHEHNQPYSTTNQNKPGLSPRYDGTKQDRVKIVILFWTRTRFFCLFDDDSFDIASGSEGRHGYGSFMKNCLES